MATLFDLNDDNVAITSDDCYTPAWVFDAMGLGFDLDVAAPAGGPWHVPCGHYYTAADDGLTQPWGGVIWCNPPHSNFGDWADRWAKYPTGVLLGQVASRQAWRRQVFAAADAIYIGEVEFQRPDYSVVKFGWTAIFVAFRGVGVAPAQALAERDRFGSVVYGSPR